MSVFHQLFKYRGHRLVDGAMNNAARVDSVDLLTDLLADRKKNHSLIPDRHIPDYDRVHIDYSFGTLTRALSVAVVAKASNAITFLLSNGASSRGLIYGAVIGDVNLFSQGVYAYPDGNKHVISVFAAKYGHPNIMQYVFDKVFTDHTYTPWISHIAASAARAGHPDIVIMTLNITTRQFSPCGLRGVLVGACCGDLPQIVTLILGPKYLGSMPDYKLTNITGLICSAVAGKSVACFDIILGLAGDTPINFVQPLGMSLQSRWYCAGIVMRLLGLCQPHSKDLNRLMRLAADNGDYDLADFIISKGGTDLAYLVRSAAGRGDLDVLLRYAGFNLHQDIVDSLVRHGHLNILKSLVDLQKIPDGSALVNIFTRSYGAFTIPSDDRIGDALWLIDHGFQDCGLAIVWALKNGPNQAILDAATSSKWCRGSGLNDLLRYAKDKDNVGMIDFVGSCR